MMKVDERQNATASVVDAPSFSTFLFHFHPR